MLRKALEEEGVKKSNRGIFYSIRKARLRRTFLTAENRIKVIAEDDFLEKMLDKCFYFVYNSY